MPVRHSADTAPCSRILAFALYVQFRSASPDASVIDSFTLTKPLGWQPEQRHNGLKMEVTVGMDNDIEVGLDGGIDLSEADLPETETEASETKTPATESGSNAAGLPRASDVLEFGGLYAGRSLLDLDLGLEDTGSGSDPQWSVEGRRNEEYDTDDRRFGEKRRSAAHFQSSPPGPWSKEHVMGPAFKKAVMQVGRIHGRQPCQLVDLWMMQV